MITSPRDVVIVDAIRTPIGRAFEGSLVGIRPDDLAAEVCVKVRDLDVVDVNEAFAAQVIPVCRSRGIDMDEQLSPFGQWMAMLFERAA